MIVRLIGPTLAVAMVTAGGAVVITRSNTLRIVKLEERITEDRKENRIDHAAIKELVIKAKDETIREIKSLLDK
jgi:hypothetical protein